MGLSFMFHSGMSWSLSLWLNASVWVMTFYLWVIAPVTIRPEALFFVLPYDYALLLAVTLNFHIVVYAFWSVYNLGLILCQLLLAFRSLQPVFGVTALTLT